MPHRKANSVVAANHKRASGEEAKLRQWRKELDWFERSASALAARPELNNKFIAVKDGKILDQDRNDVRLAKRVNKKYPRQVILIVKVPPDETVSEFPSPEIVGEV